MKLLAASLKHRIEFIESITNNAFAAIQWRVCLQTYAEIVAINEHNFRYLENLNFGHIITESLFMIRIRYTNIKLNKLKIKYNSRQFIIKKITNFQEKNQILCIIAQEIEL